MIKNIRQERVEAIQQISDDDISAPSAKTFLGIVYTSMAGKPATSMINHFMHDTEKAFEDLLMRV